MNAIFISYRRDDAEGEAGRLFADLAAKFGSGAVFMDVEGIAPGQDFRKAIDKNVASCGVLLAIVGKRWIDVTGADGRRRLDDPMDFVRLETASALKRDIPVIPVLVHGARMPRAEQLPDDIKELAYRNGVELTHVRWHSDVAHLISVLPLAKAGEDTTKTANLVRPAGKAPVASVARAQSQVPSKEPSQVKSQEPSQVPSQAQSRWRPVAASAAVFLVAVVGVGAYQYREAREAELAAAQNAIKTATANEAAARQAAAQEAIARKAAEDAVKDASAREVAARAAAAVDAAAKESLTREIAAKRVAANEATARQAAEAVAAKAVEAQKISEQLAAKEVAARETAAKEVANREAANKEVAAKEALAKDAAARDALAAEDAARRSAARSTADRRSGSVPAGAQTASASTAPATSGGSDFLAILAAALRANADVKSAAQASQSERQNMGVPATSLLHSGAMHGPTPNQIPGGNVVTTQELVQLLQKSSGQIAVFDVLGAAQKIPNALSAAAAGQPGSFNDANQVHFGQWLNQVTRGNRTIPLVFYCQGTQCWLSYNAALRAINLGYRQVLWYRGGLEAWQRAGLPLVSNVAQAATRNTVAQAR